MNLGNLKFCIPGIALFFILSGCSQPADTVQQSVTPGSISAARDVDMHAVEKVDHLISSSEIVDKAYQKSVRECMVSRGYAVRDKYPGFEMRTVRQLVIPRALSVQEARTYGYISTKEQARREKGTRDIELSENEENALTQGIAGQEPCRYSAMNSVYGSSDTWEPYISLDSYIQPYVNAYLNSEDYYSLNKEWSQCMKGKSYDYPSPGAAIRSATNTKNTQELAIADTQCRESVKYEENLQNGLNAYMTTFLNDNQALLERVAQAKKNAEANAPKILDGAAS